MICRNCKFSLNGSEKFCPNCGAALISEESSKTVSEPSPPQIPEIFSSAPFPQEKNDNTPAIFHSNYDDPISESRKRAKSSGKAPIMLMLMLVLAVLLTGLFVAAEHFGVAPALLEYLNNETTGAAEKVYLQTPTDPPSDPQKSLGLVEPDFDYAPTQAFITNINSLPLRKGPADSYGTIKALESGCQLQILGGTAINKQWIYVYIPYYDCYGWLNASFISLCDICEPAG